MNSDGDKETLNEFELIRRYFSRPVPPGYLGGGDVCVPLPVSAGKQLATSTDLLIEGRHFLPDADPGSLGHKALAVNVSDLAAMGAQPVGCLLGLSFPQVDHAWLAAFSDAFYAYAKSAHCPLIGGDTTRSDRGIVISVTVFGQVEPGRALRRDAACPGDDLWVTGELGAPHIALQMLLGQRLFDPSLLAATREALDRPCPPWRFAQGLPGLANAALDISDGLLQDLNHILQASDCGATVRFGDLPVAPALDALDQDAVREAVLSGGDVYQLCFTAPVAHREQIAGLARRCGTKTTRVGTIQRERQLTVLDEAGEVFPVSSHGFDHFGLRNA